MTKWKTLVFVALICMFAPSAYGQLAGTPLATQEFETFLPANWTVADWAVTGNNWYANNNFYIAPGVVMPNYTGGTGYCAAAAEIDPGNALAWDTGLFSPTFSIANYSAANLNFRHALETGVAGDGRGRVWLYDPAIATYYGPLVTYVADATGSVSLNLALYVGYPNPLQAVFEFDDPTGVNDSYWQIDNVSVTGVVITGIDLQANWGVFRYDGRLFARVDVRNLGWNPSGTFTVNLQVWNSGFTELLYNTTRTFTQNARGRALLPGRTKTAKFWVTNRSDLGNGWAFVNVVRAAGADDFDENSPLSGGIGNNQLLRRVR